MALNTMGIIVKYLLFLINFILFVGGMAVLILSIIAITSNTNLNQMLGTNLYSSAAYILIATSILVIIVSFLGCFGAFKEIRSMLIVYMILMLVIFLVMLIGAIVGYVFNTKVKISMRNTMINTLQNDYGRTRFWTTMWDALQQEVKCCGVDENTVPPGYSFWQTSVWYKSKVPNEKISRIPISCCDPNANPDQKNLCQNMEAVGMNYFYHEGCLKKVLNIFESKALIFSGVAIGVSILILLSIIFSLVIINQTDR